MVHLTLDRWWQTGLGESGRDRLLGPPLASVECACVLVRLCQLCRMLDRTNVKGGRVDLVHGLGGFDPVWQGEWGGVRQLARLQPASKERPNTWTSRLSLFFSPLFH